MEIELNSNRLVDSPYSSSNKELFVFDEAQIEDFINDLSFGTPTCYLVSGYRGVGKTSLVRKVEDGVVANNQSSQHAEVVFVYTSFARYESKTHIIRKLIRELYLKTEKTKKFEEISKTKQNEFTTRFEILHQQTFKEVTETTEKKTTNELTYSTQASISEVVKSVVKQIAPLVGLMIPHLFNLAEEQIKWIIYAGSILWTVFNIVNVQVQRIATNRSARSLFTKTLFDDEIAGTLFLDVLKQLHDLNFKVVFVLDELDKVSVSELNLLISEMKPYLVCGHADFIVVGGQNLYYKFNEDDNLDDSLLSSLFSKVYHVPLSSAAALRNLFFKKIVNKDALEKLSESDRKLLDAHIDYMIFSSRLIPRRFITRLRHHQLWRDGKAIVKFKDIPTQFKRCSEVISIIESLDDKKVEVENFKAIRDYILMKMYINCTTLLNSKAKTLDKNLLINGRP